MIEKFDFVVTTDTGEFCKLPRDGEGFKRDDVTYQYVTNCLECRHCLECLLSGLDEYNRRQDEEMFHVKH